MAQIRADVDNGRADTDYKRELVRWETWKVVTIMASVVIAALGVGSGLTLAFLALVK